MRNYNNPEMKIASFDKEAVAVTASTSTFNNIIEEWVGEKSGRQSANVDYEQMPSVSFGF